MKGQLVTDVTEVTFRNDFDVELLDRMGDDARVCQAARISNLGARAEDTTESENLIRFLMKGRHGTPFEHCTMQWLISAPIFVWREFHRHRMASYNEQSSRWMQLAPVFYEPPADRSVVRRKDTRKGDYAYEPAEEDSLMAGYFLQYRENLRDSCRAAYAMYEAAIGIGIAGEVARMHLPVNVYSSCYVTMNLRGLMNFLSLRTAETAQREIRQVAFEMEQQFREAFPLVWKAWNDNGKVAP